MPWYQIVGGQRELVPKDAYVVVGGERRPLRKLYVVVDGQRRLFFVAAEKKAWSDELTAVEDRSLLIRRSVGRDEVAQLTDDGFGVDPQERDTPKTWQDGLTASETRDLLIKRPIGRDESATLAGTFSRERVSEGPDNLSVVYSSAACEMQLAWDPDNANQQEIYRCTGSGCSPTTKIDTVAAGVSSYGDSVDQTSVGVTARYEVRSSAGTSNEDGATKSFQCAD